jgi:hypothetical protein
MHNGNADETLQPMAAAVLKMRIGGELGQVFNR